MLMISSFFRRHDRWTRCCTWCMHVREMQKYQQTSHMNQRFDKSLRLLKKSWNALYSIKQSLFAFLEVIRSSLTFFNFFLQRRDKFLVLRRLESNQIFFVVARLEQWCAFFYTLRSYTTNEKNHKRREINANVSFATLTIASKASFISSLLNLTSLRKKFEIAR